MLSYAKYLWKCVLGIELMFVGCIFYGSLLSGERAELHHALLELFPFFKWGQPFSIVITAVCLGLYALLFGWYIVWMHNSSIE